MTKWPLCKLGSIAEIVSGATPKTKIPEYWAGDILWATPKDLGQLETIEIEDTERKITKAGYESCSTKLLPVGSVLLSSRAPIGHLAINTKPICTNQGFKSLIPKEGLYNRYLYWALKHSIPQLQGLGRGCTFKEISKGLIESFRIPVPPLDEQRRIMARIEELTRRAEEARRLRQEALSEAFSILGSCIEQTVSNVSNDYVPLGTFLSEGPRNGWSPKADNKSVNGIPVLTLSAVTGFHYDGSKIKWTTVKTKEDAHYWLKPGELLITRSNTLEFVGHSAIYDGTPSPCICPDLIMKMTIREEAADTMFINYWLQSTMVRDYIRKNARGTSGSMKKINQSHVKNIPVPKISLPLQRIIVKHLNKVRSKTDEILNLQKEVESKISTFTPALLAKAFWGEL